MPRQYTDEQLAEIARPFEAHAIDALQAGDIIRVRELLKEMAAGHLGLDALSVHTLARKIGKLRQDFTEEEARAALLRISHELMRTWIDQFREGDERDAIGALVEVHKYQGGAQLHCSETEDEVVVDLAPCGSGGRLEQQGVTKKYPQWYAGWSDGVSGYCQGCKAHQQALNDAVGEPVWTTEKGADGHCRMRFRKHRHQGQRLFSDTELDQLAKTRVQQMQDKLDAGDHDIVPLLHGQRKEWKPWHDFAVCWLEFFYGNALATRGTDYLDETLRATYEPAFEIGLPRYAAMSDDELVREIAKTWNYHCADFTLREEDDRFVFVLDPCGSGGRLLRGEMWRDMFRYGQPLAPFIALPHNITFGRSEAPAYCTHCAASNRAQLKAGPFFFVIDGHAQMKPGQACRQFSYKKGISRQQVDPALLAQIGMHSGPASNNNV
ncbi:MAG TPA: hypothetical protein VJ698_19910 [Noviherbaspirillum sp.]|uniref:hypothetical protein n=1 Tax=Noviherbaspirillum sp. TaxID=1926288 RepID=UPI002B4904EC|nr:hypothetical protein [Noviherbaspirillum sp.]HJV87746.1 hypothetical protein [Noviherbaspirillum sp.]